MEQDNKSAYYNGQQFNEEEQSSFNLMEWVFRFLKYWYLFAIGALIAISYAYLQNRTFVLRYRSEAQIFLQETQSAYSFMNNFSAGQNRNNIDNQRLMLLSYDLIARTIDSLHNFNVDYSQKLAYKDEKLYGNSIPFSVEVIEVQDNAYALDYNFIPKEDSTFIIDIYRGKDKIESVQGRYNDLTGCQYFLINVNKTKRNTDEHANSNSNTVKIKRKINLDFILSKLDASAPKHNLYFKFRSRENLIDEFVGRLSASNLEKTSVLKITLEGENPTRDRVFLNKHAESFLLENLDRKNYEAIKTINFINEQLATISDSLSKAETDLNAFRVANGMYGSINNSGILSNKLQTLDEQGKQIKARDTYFKYLREYLTKNIDNTSLAAPSSIGMQDPQLMAYITDYNQLRFENTELGEENPIYKNNQTKMLQIKQQLYELMNSMSTVYDLERQSYRQNLGQVESMLNSAPSKELKMLNLERGYKINDSYYTFLLQKRSEAQIRKASNAPDNTILQKARNMGSTNSKQKSEKYTKYLLVGLLIPAAFVIIKELLNNKIRNDRDVEKLSKFPVIGYVNHTKHRPEEKVLSIKYPNSIFVEQLRVIRTKIELILQRRENFSILISSTESGDGKTYISSNLAGTFALQKKRVLLIDFDLRRPSLTAEMNSTSRKMGFVNYMLGEITLEQVVEKKEEYGFDFLSAGIFPPNPGEFIRNSKVKTMLEELKQIYQYIIIDTSPVGLVADAYALMQITDIHLLIARCFRTNKNSFAFLCKRLFNDGVENSYIILNDVNKNKVGYGRYGYGHGYYGYGNAYGRKKDNYYTTEYFEKEKISLLGRLYDKVMRWLGR